MSQPLGGIMGDFPDLPAILDRNNVGVPATMTAYENARRALTVAVDADEVKHILDITVAMAAYAKQAKDEDLIAKATELRKRAERRLGEMIEKQKLTVGLAKGSAGQGRPKIGGVSKTPPKQKVPTLEEAGVDKNLAKRARSAAKLPKDKFEEEVGKATSRAVAAVSGDKEIIKQARAEQNKSKKEKRAAKERDLAAKIIALPNKRYGAILADPEWRFEPYSRQTGVDRAADNHYPTSPTKIIAARPVRDIAAEDCALFLWATVPMLPDALEVMAAWGFDYVSHFIWSKPTAGTGYWNRNKHELLLVGTRGSIPAPSPGTQRPSVFEAPVGAHSVKPVEAYELIEAYFPNLPKIELNARQARPGWDAWGNEAPGDGVPS